MSNCMQYLVRSFVHSIMFSERTAGRLLGAFSDETCSITRLALYPAKKIITEPHRWLVPCCINILLPAEPFHPDHKSGHPNHVSSCSIKISVIGPTQVYNTVNRKCFSFFDMEGTPPFITYLVTA